MHLYFEQWSRTVYLPDANTPFPTVATDTRMHTQFLFMIMFPSQSSPRGPRIASGAPQTMLPTHVHIDTARARTQQTHTPLPLTEPMHATICHIYPSADLILEAGSSVRLPAKCLIHEPKCSRSSRFCVSRSISTCINHVIICIFIVKQWNDQKLLPARTAVHIFIPTMLVIILISDSVWASH